MNPQFFPLTKALNHLYSHFRNDELTTLMLEWLMTDETQNLVLDILRKIQADIAILKTDIKDIKNQLIDIRTHLVTMQNDALRQERAMAAVQLRIERIESRLELTEH